MESSTESDTTGASPEAFTGQEGLPQSGADYRGECPKRKAAAASETAFPGSGKRRRNSAADAAPTAAAGPAGIEPPPPPPAAAAAATLPAEHEGSSGEPQAEPQASSLTEQPSQQSAAQETQELGLELSQQTIHLLKAATSDDVLLTFIDLLKDCRARRTTRQFTFEMVIELLRSELQEQNPELLQHLEQQMSIFFDGCELP